MKLLFLLPLIAMAAMPAAVESPAKAERSAPAPLSDRQKVLAVATSQVGTVEKTGRNDGEVDKYLAAVGLGGTRNPYCAACVYWIGREALGSRNPYPKSAWSPDMLKGGVRVTEGTVIKGGETFGIYFPNKGRIAHTGLVERRDGSCFVTLEGNTSPQAAAGSAKDRDGDGFWRKRRPWRTIHSTKDWLAK
jgi:hypothetical protein